MEEKLIIEHLAPYLPYVVKGYHLEYKKYWSDLYPENVEWFINNNSRVKIVLRPLSDLTKEIKVNGEKFVPIEKLEKLFEFKGGNPPTMSDCSVNMESYLEYQKLFEWHFDIFGLIKDNLAIDINTL